MSKRPKLIRYCFDCEEEFLGTMAARFCPNCRWKHRGQKKLKYEWTPEREKLLRDRYNSTIRGRAAEIAESLGWPKWVIKKRAQQIGLSHAVNRKEWTQEDLNFLLEHCGSRTSHWISKQLGRSETSVVMKCKHLQISRRVQQGYTMRELELCFGTDHHVIERWISQGKLKARRRRTARKFDIWAVTDEQILNFIINHPLSFRLDKVDQTWFMDLITAAGIMRKALKALRADGDPEEMIA